MGPAPTMSTSSLKPVPAFFRPRIQQDRGLDQSAYLIGYVLGQLDHISVLNADGGDADILLKAAVKLIADGLAVQASVGAARRQLLQW